MKANKKFQTHAWVLQNPKWQRHRVKLLQVYHRFPANKHWTSLLEKLVVAQKLTTTMKILSPICLEATLVMKICSSRWRKIKKVPEIRIRRKTIITFSKDSYKMIKAKGWRLTLRVLSGLQVGWVRSPGLARGYSQPKVEIHREVDSTCSNNNSLKLPRTAQRKAGLQVLQSQEQLLEGSRTHITRMTYRGFWTPPKKVLMRMMSLPKTKMTARLWNYPSFSNLPFTIHIRMKILGMSLWRSPSILWENWMKQI